MKGQTRQPIAGPIARPIARPITLALAEPPILMVVIDTEEEFDWHADFDRDATGVTHMAHIGRVQAVFRRHGIRPTYVVDYAIAAQAEGFGPLKAFADAGEAVIGAHLHPWVSPPHEEAVTRRNSFPGNLPRELERAKLEALAAQIERSFGARPRLYKAGRYGIGPNTAGILQDLGFEVDLSPAPPMDFRSDGGPDFSRHGCAPFWHDGTDGLLVLPGTGAFTGRLHGTGPSLYRALGHDRLRWARLPGIAARLGLLDRLWLSPEGYSAAELKKLTRFLLARGQRLFVLSFHSPSVQPGCTPYVRTEADLARFLDVLGGYFEFFLRTLGGTTMTPQEFRAKALALSASEGERT